MNEHKEYQSDKVDLRVWRRLIAYAMRRPRRVAGLGATLLVVSAIDILYPAADALCIDHFVEGHTAQGLGWFALLYVACVAVQGAGVFFFVRGAGRLEMDICYDIRQDAFHAAATAVVQLLRHHSVGWLMARMGSGRGPPGRDDRLEPCGPVLVWLFRRRHRGTRDLVFLRWAFWC